MPFILPLGDEPILPLGDPRGVPWATYLLIAINSAVYLLIAVPLSLKRPDFNDPALLEYVRVLANQLPQGLSQTEVLERISAYDLVVFNFGFRPANPVPLALVTSMFLHGGFMHLAGNMLFLWIYGDNVEHRLGRGRFLLAYFATGLAATFVHTAFDTGSELPVVGASGAISGVLGFYFIWFPRNRVRLWIMVFPFFMNVVRAPARLVLGFYLIMDNLVPFLLTQGIEGGGVAYGAHLGGFLGGLGWAWWAGRREVVGQPTEYRSPSGQAPTLPGELVPTLMSEDRFRDAATAYFRLTSEQARRLLTPEHSIALGNWLAAHDHPEAALVLYQRHLRDYPLGPLDAEAHLGAGLVQLNALRQPTAAYQHLVEVFDLHPDTETETRARQALTDIAARQKFRVPERRTKP